MKINTSHLVGAAIVLAAVFFSKLDVQSTPAPVPAERQQWEYAFIRTQIINGKMFLEVLTHDGEIRTYAGGNGPTTPYPYGLQMFHEGPGLHTKSLREIQAMGNAGWELIETLNNGGQYSQMYYHFKRPVQ